MLAILLIIISEVKRKTEKKKKKKATERLASYPRIRKRVLYKSMLWLVFKKASVIFVVHTCSVLYLQCIILGQIVKSQWCLKLAYNIFFMLRLYYYRFPCFMIKQKLELAALCLSVFEYLTCFKLVWYNGKHWPPTVINLFCKEVDNLSQVTKELHTFRFVYRYLHVWCAGTCCVQGLISLLFMHASQVVRLSFEKPGLDLAQDRHMLPWAIRADH